MKHTIPLYTCLKIQQVIAEPTIFLGRLEVVFNLVCILLAMYMASTQMLRHIENRDTSFIHIKQFDGAKGDNYPSFSLCFQGGELNLSLIHI